MVFHKPVDDVFRSGPMVERDTFDPICLERPDNDCCSALASTDLQILTLEGIMPVREDDVTRIRLLRAIIQNMLDEEVDLSCQQLLLFEVSQRLTFEPNSPNMSI